MLDHMWFFFGGGDSSWDGAYENWAHRLGANAWVVSDWEYGSIQALPLVNYLTLGDLFNVFKS